MPISGGERLGLYAIPAPFGAGHGGHVYRVHRTCVAFDIPHKVSARQFSERFEREAHLVASIWKYPNADRETSQWFPAASYNANGRDGRAISTSATGIGCPSRDATRLADEQPKT